MKKILILLMIFSVGIANAQEGNQDRKEKRKELRANFKDVSVEQMAELKTKQLTLNLDLSPAQEIEMKKFQLQQATKRKEYFETRKDKKDVSASERIELKTKMVEEKIAAKNKMKTILTEDQFKKWEQHLAERKMKRSKRHRKMHQNKENR